MTAIITDPGVLEFLDFTPELPCEHSQHSASPRHSGPARYLIESRCARCPRRGTLLLCETAWLRTKTLHCTTCRAERMPRDECWSIVQVIS